MTIISGTPTGAPAILQGWKSTVVSTLRALTGDFDSTDYKYTDQRLIQSFLVCSNLVLFDVDFSEDYKVNVQGEEILPDPVEDGDFLTLGCLKTACILLTSEGKSASGCKISMKDGPSTITLDKSDLIKTINDMSKSVCGKYEQAMFIYKSEGTLGVGILGPHGVGASLQHGNSRNIRY